MNSCYAWKSGTSKLYEVIKILQEKKKCLHPGAAQLTIAEIDSIGQWISYGALNENCGEVCDTINPVTFSGTIWPVMQTSCTGCHSGASPSVMSCSELIVMLLQSLQTDFLLILLKEMVLQKCLLEVLFLPAESDNLKYG